MLTKKVQLSLAAALLVRNVWAWVDAHANQKSGDQFSSDMAFTWFEQLYDIVKAEETTPPPAARIGLQIQKGLQVHVLSETLQALGQPPAGPQRLHRRTEISLPARWVRTGARSRQTRKSERWWEYMTSSGAENQNSSDSVYPRRTHTCGLR